MRSSGGSASQSRALNAHFWPLGLPRSAISAARRATRLARRGDGSGHDVRRTFLAGAECRAQPCGSLRGLRQGFAGLGEIPGQFGETLLVGFRRQRENRLAMGALGQHRLAGLAQAQGGVGIVRHLEMR